MDPPALPPRLVAREPLMNPRIESEEMDQSLGLFEAAFSHRRLRLDDIPKGPLLVALDGSDQDDTVRALSAVLAARLGVDREEFRPNLVADPRQVAEQILSRARGIEAVAIVLDVPFGEELRALGRDSLGAVVDILLKETTRPIALVRDPVADPMKSIVRPVVLLDWRDSLQNLSGAWAARLATPGGEIDLVAAPEPGTMAELRLLLGADAHLLDDLLARAESRISGSLLAALNHLSSDAGFSVRLEVQAERSPVESVLARSRGSRPILIAYRPAESALGLMRVRAVAQGATSPVIALPVLP